MGNCNSGGDPAGREASAAIDAELRKYKAQLQQERKILLLGLPSLLHPFLFSQLDILLIAFDFA